VCENEGGGVPFNGKRVKVNEHMVSGHMKGKKRAANPARPSKNGLIRKKKRDWDRSRGEKIAGILDWGGGRSGFRREDKTQGPPPKKRGHPPTGRNEKKKGRTKHCTGTKKGLGKRGSSPARRKKKHPKEGSFWTRGVCFPPDWPGNCKKNTKGKKKSTPSPRKKGKGTHRKRPKGEEFPAVDLTPEKDNTARKGKTTIPPTKRRRKKGARHQDTTGKRNSKTLPETGRGVTPIGEEKKTKGPWKGKKKRKARGGGKTG